MQSKAGGVMAKCEGDFTGSCKIMFEHSIAIDGAAYTVIAGNHINGGFCAIPKKRIAAEISQIDRFFDKYYTAGKLEESGMKAKDAAELAAYMADFAKNHCE